MYFGVVLTRSRDSFHSNSSRSVAMVWGDRTVAELDDWVPHASTTHLLGFNEPNLRHQSNLTAARACELWPAVVAAAKKHNLLLGSPAANHCLPGQK